MRAAEYVQCRQAIDQHAQLIIIRAAETAKSDQPRYQRLLRKLGEWVVVLTSMKPRERTAVQTGG